MVGDWRLGGRVCSGDLEGSGEEMLRVLYLRGHVRLEVAGARRERVVLRDLYVAVLSS